jgi:hypothetical protein
MKNERRALVKCLKKNVIEMLICPPQILDECRRIERGPLCWETEDLLQHRDLLNPGEFIIIITIIIIQ